MKEISKLILIGVLSAIFSNVYAGNIYYFYCMHITADTSRAYFSPVRTVNKSRDDINITELGRQFSLSINKPGKTSCYGYDSDKVGDDDEAMEGREKGIKFLKNKGLVVSNSDMQSFSDYVKILND